MSTLYRRPSSYYLSWYCAPGCPRHPAGHQQHCVSLRTTDQKRAQFVQKEKDKSLDADRAKQVLGLTTVAVADRDLTLERFIEQYEQKVTTEQLVSRNTWDRAEQWALKRLLAHDPLAVMIDLTPDWIARYEAAEKLRISPYTWNSRRATLRAIGNRAVAWRWLATNPFLHLTRAKEKRKRPKRLLQEHLPIVLAAIPGRFWRLVTLFFYATGVRRQELCNLERTHVRWRQGFLEIETNKENEPKVIALTPEIEAIITEAQALCDSEYVFSNTGRRLHPEAVKNYYRWISKKVGFPVSTHRFRHSHGTHRMESGDNLKLVSSTLGHADIRTTADFYLDMDLPAQRAALARLPIRNLLKIVRKAPKPRSRTLAGVL